MCICCCNPKADFRHLLIGCFGFSHALSALLLWGLLSTVLLDGNRIAQSFYPWINVIRDFDADCDVSEITPQIWNNVLSKSRHALVVMLQKFLCAGFAVSVIMSVFANVGAGSRKMEKAWWPVFALLVLYVALGVTIFLAYVWIAKVLEAWAPCASDKYSFDTIMDVVLPWFIANGPALFGMHIPANLTPTEETRYILEFFAQPGHLGGRGFLHFLSQGLVWAVPIMLLAKCCGRKELPEAGDQDGTNILVHQPVMAQQQHDFHGARYQPQDVNVHQYYDYGYGHQQNQQVVTVVQDQTTFEQCEPLIVGTTSEAGGTAALPAATTTVYSSTTSQVEHQGHPDQYYAFPHTVREHAGPAGGGGVAARAAVAHGNDIKGYWTHPHVKDRS
ncbi:unnamed protein product [Amoebophrya sp. A120]|nr:unnamed protein product [Amoebophrya sp. A120]|eukprot:GSA120T00009296001.1